MKVSIITCTYNRLKYVKQSLESLIENTNCEFELRIVENASCDGTGEYVNEFANKHRTRVKLFEAGTNIGQGAGYNLAAKDTTGDVMIFVDSDVVVPSGWAQKLASVVNASEEIGWIAPWFNGERYFINRIKVDKFERIFNGEALVCTPFVSGTVTCMTKRAYLKIGKFREEFIYGGLDVEYCRRAQEKGYAVGFTKRVDVQHLNYLNCPEFKEYNLWKAKSRGAIRKGAKRDEIELYPDGKWR